MSLDAISHGVIRLYSQMAEQPVGCSIKFTNLTFAPFLFRVVIHNISEHSHLNKYYL